MPRAVGKRKSASPLVSPGAKRQRVERSRGSRASVTAAAAAAAAAAAEAEAEAASASASVEPDAEEEEDDGEEQDEDGGRTPATNDNSRAVSPDQQHESLSSLSEDGAGAEEEEEENEEQQQQDGTEDGNDDDDDEEAEEEDEEGDEHDEEDGNRTVDTPASSPEVELAIAAAGKTVSQRRGPTIREEDEDDEEEEERTEDDADVQPGAQQVSAKTVPGQQPRPGDTIARPTTGGKGKKGEEAIENAVAAREQVERRRVELKENHPEAASAAAVATAPPPLAQLKREQQQKQQELVQQNRRKAAAAAAAVADADAETEDTTDFSSPKKERPAIAEEKANIIRFAVVTNDGNPESLIILTGLMNIFQRQLPKMPREYIARLVFDRNHWSMAIVKRGLQVVGGITYRPFEAREFAEIVFCAITGTEQVKGYGSHLMNHLKDHVKASSRCMHFLTYADNYAIGYFKKQGFTKEIGLDRSVWAGYIKDYEGGTIMHCAMLPRIKYLEVGSILSRQKEVILREIRQVSRSHVVHPGIAKFSTLAPGSSLDPSDVPGLKESGWTPEMDELTRRPVRGPQFAIMQRLLTMLVDHPSAWAFANPVNAQEVTDYYDVIKEPMDLATMDRKLESNQYESLDDFVKDARLIFSNCRSYNDASSNYVKNANKLEAFLNEQLKAFNDA